jgi:hypothetical protein
MYSEATVTDQRRHHRIWKLADTEDVSALVPKSIS